MLCTMPCTELRESDTRLLAKLPGRCNAVRVQVRLDMSYQGVQLLADATTVVALAQLAHITPEQQQVAPLALGSAKQGREASELSWVLKVGDHQVLQIQAEVSTLPLQAQIEDTRGIEVHKGFDTSAL